MKDWFNSLLKFVDHYRWTVICLAAGIAIVATLAGVVGCASTTPSLLPDAAGNHPLITRTEFAAQATEAAKIAAVTRADLDKQIAAYNAEVAALNEQAAAGVADLDAQDEYKAALIQAATVNLTELAAGTVNPASLIATGVLALTAITGIGASVDNRRKDKVIKTIKSYGPDATAGAAASTSAAPAA